jgi:hypothetical protein
MEAVSYVGVASLVDFFRVTTRNILADVLTPRAMTDLNKPEFTRKIFRD